MAMAGIPNSENRKFERCVTTFSFLQIQGGPVPAPPDIVSLTSDEGFIVHLYNC